MLAGSVACLPSPKSVLTFLLAFRCKSAHAEGVDHPLRVEDGACLQV